jgi:hypothetical protein
MGKEYEKITLTDIVLGIPALLLILCLSVVLLVGTTVIITSWSTETLTLRSDQALITKVKTRWWGLSQRETTYTFNDDQERPRWTKMVDDGKTDTLSGQDWFVLHE